jgi:signal transduction histidine kinase/HAMP domain-containing protein
MAMPRLRLKTKLVLAISALVFTLVAALSCLYLSQIFRERIKQSYDDADFITHQLLHAARQALETDVPVVAVAPPNQDDFARDRIAAILQRDSTVTNVLESVVGYNAEVYDAALVDRNGVALIHTDSSAINKTVPVRPDFAVLRNGSFFAQLAAVYGPAGVYQVRLPVERQGKPFGEVRVGLSTLFLKSELVPQFNRALLLSASALVLSLLIAAILSNYALRPLEAIARRLDAMAAEPAPEQEAERGRTDEFGAVTHRIDRLGRQMHDVREVFSALKENLDQLMSTLQEGLVLFTRDGKIVLVSASAERFIGVPRNQMLGATAEQVFNDSTRLGRIVLDAFALRQDVSLREIEMENGRRAQISLDFISERGVPIGALLTVRDAESVRRLGNEIELSRRLAAIGRLTSGVAHEVKNPINAIVIHLEILRERILQLDPESRRHMDIINKEIHRLDRVVQTLVDFSRPIELKLTRVDLRSLAADVAALAAPEAHVHEVQLVQEMGSEPLPVRVDNDLMKQAILNVVINGIQAMADGGTLTLRAFAAGHAAVLEVRDTGPGIAPEIRDKIFNLYFTTKKTGSGIGLALTFRAVQMHNGAVDLESEPGHGATFRIRLPLWTAEIASAESSTASDIIDQHAVSASGEAVNPPPH